MDDFFSGIPVNVNERGQQLPLALAIIGGSFCII